MQVTALNLIYLDLERRGEGLMLSAASATCLAETLCQLLPRAARTAAAEASNVPVDAAAQNAAISNFISIDVLEWTLKVNWACMRRCRHV